MNRERRIRELSSERRAGSGSRESAARKQYDFLRAHPLLPLFLVGLLAAVLPMVLLLPEPTRAFAAGALTSSVFWLGVLLVRQLSGVGYLHLGELGEKWTAQELKPFVRSNQWRVIHRLILRRYSDIDHVLIGPAGVVVIETKGGATDWMEPHQQGRIGSAVAQVNDNARRVRNVVRGSIGDAPTYAVVALWPARSAFETRVQDGVVVLSGHRLREWVDSLSMDTLGPDGVDGAWTTLSETLRGREQFELEAAGPPPRSMEQLAFDLVQFPLGFLAAFLGFAVITQVNVAALVVSAVTSLVVGWRVDRHDYPLRRFVRGVLACAAFVLVVFAAMSAWYWIR